MKHFQPAIETEYDFALHYSGACPFKIGEEVKSGVRDDNRQVVFEGSAVVVLIESNSFNGTTVYVRQFKPIKLVGGMLTDGEYEYKIL
jgi:hypothetical protein